MTNQIILIELGQNCDEALVELAKEFPDSMIATKPRRFDGLHLVTQVAVVLSSTIIPAICKIVLEQIRAKQHVKLILNGIEIQGVSETTIEKILKDLNEQSNKSNSER